MSGLKLATSCILRRCRKRIPDERQRRNAITCSRACQKLYRKLRKKERDLRICQHCGRPSTPEEKALFRLWRQEHALRNAGREKRVLIAAKGIREHAYICPERPRRRRRREIAARAR